MKKNENKEQKIKNLKKELKTKNEFWYNQDKNLRIRHYELLEFLESKGFYKSVNGRDIKMLRIANNIIEEINEVQIGDYVIEHLNQINEDEVKEVFIKGISHYGSKKFLSALKSLDLDYPKDTKENAIFYFKNKVVDVGCEVIKVQDYASLSYPIAKDMIINYNYKESSKGISDFETFIYNISKKDDARFESLKSVIGYLLHNHQDPSNAKAVIFTDENISGDKTANGGVGKSLIHNAIAKLRNVVTLDGKNLKNGSKFFFQQVNRSTNIICFDDVHKTFDFETLYSSITSGIVVEKKFETEYTIPFDQTPKIIISSNYSVVGTGGNSENRRRIDFEIANYYNDKLTPISEFGKRFFDDWNEEEWSAFYKFMFDCLKLYLEKGVIEAKPINLNKSRLVQETSSEFYEFMNLNVKYNEWID
ncbi:MAG: hypothetical protein KDC67_07740, partial [Ignavibacteriae bacterium]|nr:hypothetical protein [Ignavibacteriota bacterium]